MKLTIGIALVLLNFGKSLAANEITCGQSGHLAAVLHIDGGTLSFADVVNTDNFSIPVFQPAFSLPSDSTCSNYQIGIPVKGNPPMTMCLEQRILQGQGGLMTVNGIGGVTTFDFTCPSF